MYLAKIIEGSIALIECEDGREVRGDRTEQELLTDGWKPACMTDKPSEDAVEGWKEYPACFVQEWEVPQEEPEL